MFHKEGKCNGGRDRNCKLRNFLFPSCWVPKPEALLQSGTVAGIVTRERRGWKTKKRKGERKKK